MKIRKGGIRGSIEGQTTQWSKEEKNTKINNGQQNTTQKANDFAFRTLLETMDGFGCSGMAVPAPIMSPVMLILFEISYESICPKSNPK